MIIQKNEYPLPADMKEQMRGGNGTVSIQPLLPETPPNCRLYSLITLPSGASIGEHEHLGECELFYFLGDAVVLDDGQRKQVKAGDVMMTGNGHSHSVINEGAGELQLLAVIVTE